jgi:hypothetical protein
LEIGEGMGIIEDICKLKVTLKDDGTTSEQTTN